MRWTAPRYLAVPRAASRKGPGGLRSAEMLPRLAALFRRAPTAARNAALAAMAAADDWYGVARLPLWPVFQSGLGRAMLGMAQGAKRWRPTPSAYAWHCTPHNAHRTTHVKQAGRGRSDTKSVLLHAAAGTWDAPPALLIWV